jgi:hypothetical protein
MKCTSHPSDQPTFRFSADSLTRLLRASLILRTITQKGPHIRHESPSDQVTAIIGMPSRLQSVEAAGFARNQRPTSSECAGCRPPSSKNVTKTNPVGSWPQKLTARAAATEA